mmetsp:Transcript_26756/g.48589  ORF Transcript_26756/g.48589 Transcript_26756/m.48589 type:complete len:231 (-) Transcript_26756:46-738(-)
MTFPIFVMVPSSTSLPSFPIPINTYLLVLDSGPANRRVGRTEPGVAPFLNTLAFSVMRSVKAPPNFSSSVLAMPVRTGAASSSDDSSSESSSSSSSFPAGAYMPTITRSASLTTDASVDALMVAGTNSHQSIVPHGLSKLQVVNGLFSPSLSLLMLKADVLENGATRTLVQAVVDDTDDTDDTAAVEPVVRTAERTNAFPTALRGPTTKADAAEPDKNSIVVNAELKICI